MGSIPKGSWGMGESPGSTPPAKSEEYTPSAPPNVVSFLLKGVQPPPAVYIQRDDRLVIQGVTQIAGGDTITVGLRILMGDTGQIVPTYRTLALPAAGTLYTLVIELAEGYLLSLAITSAGAATFGQTYVSAYIGRGTSAGATPTPAEMLVADYPTSTIPVGWPGVPIRQSAQAQGTVSSVQITTPAAGAVFLFTAQTGLRTRVHSLCFRLTTDATVANRDVTVYILDAAAHAIAQMPSNTLLVASKTGYYTYALGGVYVNDTTVISTLVPFLQVDLLGGWQIEGLCTLIQAGDQFSNIWMELETWVA